MFEFKSHLQHADTLIRLLRHAKSRPEELRRFQDSKLRFLVASAYHRVPFYRSKFDAAGTGLGDIAVRGPDRCPCGAPFSTLKSIKGRQMDTCVTPDGRKIHHWELIPMSFWDMPWFRRYQLVQKTPAHVVLRVIASGEPPAEDLRKLESGVLEKLGPTGTFDIEFVDEIAFANSGKHQACRSEVGSESV